MDPVVSNDESHPIEPHKVPQSLLPGGKKRKVALYCGYLGAGYQGMARQQNEKVKTIEGELEAAMCAAGAISEHNAGSFKKVQWSRAARTDKGVSAVGQVVGVKMMLKPDDIVDRINAKLPDQIRVYGYIRATDGFDAWQRCDRRRYVYMVPEWMFDPTVGNGRDTEVIFGARDRDDGQAAAATAHMESVPPAPQPADSMVCGRKRGPQQEASVSYRGELSVVQGRIDTFDREDSINVKRARTDQAAAVDSAVRPVGSLVRSGEKPPRSHAHPCVSAAASTRSERLQASPTAAVIGAAGNEDNAGIAARSAPVSCNMNGPVPARGIQEQEAAGPAAADVDMVDTDNTAKEVSGTPLAAAVGSHLHPGAAAAAGPKLAGAAAAAHSVKLEAEAAGTVGETAEVVASPPPAAAAGMKVEADAVEGMGATADTGDGPLAEAVDGPPAAAVAETMEACVSPRPAVPVGPMGPSPGAGTVRLAPSQLAMQRVESMACSGEPSVGFLIGEDEAEGAVSGGPGAVATADPNDGVETGNRIEASEEGKDEAVCRASPADAKCASNQRGGLPVERDDSVYARFTGRAGSMTGSIGAVAGPAGRSVVCEQRVRSTAETSSPLRPPRAGEVRGEREAKAVKEGAAQNVGQTGGQEREEVGDNEDVGEAGVGPQGDDVEGGGEREAAGGDGDVDEGEEEVDGEEGPEAAVEGDSAFFERLRAQINSSTYTFDEREEQRLNAVLKMYQGVQNFHNFTNRMPSHMPQAKRNILTFTCGGVIDLAGSRWVLLEVLGQSFVLHQIRKMVGLAIAVMRGLLPAADVRIALDPRRKLHVPMAPALGLYLDECIYQSYNNTFGNLHGQLSMESFQPAADRLRQDVLWPHIAQQDSEELVNARWLCTLNEANFGFTKWKQNPNKQQHAVKAEGE